jgi:transcription antitermination factor NusG
VKPRADIDGVSAARNRPESQPVWCALWVRSQCEQLVHDQLLAKGFDPFLPRIETWCRRGGQRYRVRVPMFPGYLFLHHEMDAASCAEVARTRGLTRILGDGWANPAAIPESEVHAIRRLAELPMPVLPHPYLRTGQRVCITRGVLAGIEGLFVRVNPVKGLLIVSVHLLQRSVAVEVDWSAVLPA